MNARRVMSLSLALVLWVLPHLLHAQNPPVIKNSVDHVGIDPTGITYIPQTDAILVVDRTSGSAWTYDLNLVPIGSIPSPGPQMTGVAYVPDPPRLVWLDEAERRLYYTQLNGVLITTFDLGVPMAPTLGDLDTTFNFPSPPGSPILIWAVVGSNYREFLLNGTATGNVVLNPSGPGGVATGISYRGDNRDLQIPNGPSMGGTTTRLDKVNTAGQIVGDPIDLTGIDPLVTGNEFVLFGSDGVKAHYLVANSSNKIFEIAATDRFMVFIRGDANGDGGVNISDAIAVLDHRFGGVPLQCLRSGDSNDDGGVNIADAIHLLAFLFSMGPPPPHPHPQCGDDPTPDPLTCDSHFCP